MSKRVLVTGADGFIGSHLAERLIVLGYEVVALSMYRPEGTCGWLDHIEPAALGSMRVVSGDVRDPQSMLALTEGCDAVLHLAALIGIPYSYVSPDSYVQTNVVGTLNMLQASRACGVERYVQTSTSEVYGTAEYVPIDEVHPLKAQSPYAATKIASDQLALSFHRTFDLPAVVLRPFNTYGPRQSTRAIIPTIVSQVAAGKRDISLGSVSPTRDLTYVADTVSGFVAALETPDVEGCTFNLGTGYEISVADLALTIAEVMGVEINLVSQFERVRPTLSEVERLLADNGLAKSILGWKPDLTGHAGLVTGLRRCVEWFLEGSNAFMFDANRYSI